MATKTFCDWCEEGAGGSAACHMELKRSVYSYAGRGPTSIEMDLCAECSRRLWNMLLAQVPDNVLPGYARTD